MPMLLLLLLPGINEEACDMNRRCQSSTTKLRPSMNIHQAADQSAASGHRAVTSAVSEATRASARACANIYKTSDTAQNINTTCPTFVELLRANTLCDKVDSKRVLNEFQQLQLGINKFDYSGTKSTRKLV